MNAVYDPFLLAPSPSYAPYFQHSSAQAEETEADVVKPHQLRTWHVNLLLVHSLLHAWHGGHRCLFSKRTHQVAYPSVFLFPSDLSPLVRKHSFV